MSAKNNYSPHTSAVGHGHRVHLDVREEDGFGTQAGVKKVVAAQMVWTKRTKIVLGLCLSIASFMHTLDNGSNYGYSTGASSAFGHASALQSINAASAIILSVGKPLFGKLMNVVGRGEVFAHCLFFTCLGYAICASTPNMNGFGAGQVLYTVGASGFQIAVQVVVADITTLRYRSFFSSLAGSGWYFVLFYGSGQIAQLIPENMGWRWGYGLYAICYVPAILPIIIILLWAQYKAKKTGVIVLDSDRLGFSERAKKLSIDLDLGGLFLLLVTLVLIFLPMILANQVITWHNAAIPSMMVIGGVVTLPAFIYWEIKIAKYPVMPARFLGNRTVLMACITALFDFISFYLSYGQLYFFVQVATDWSLSDLNYYAYSQSLCLTFFAIAWGLVAMITKMHWKWSLFGGLCVRLLGVSLMLHTRSNTSSTGELVMTQVLQGAGGGVVSAATQVGAQGAVSHQDLALATAAILLFAELGNVIGNSAATALNAAYLPKKIAEQFPEFNSTEVMNYVGAPFTARLLGPPGTPDRDRMITAFSETQRLLLIPAIVMAIVPMFAAVFMKDFKLDHRRNIVEDDVPMEDLDRDTSSMDHGKEPDYVKTDSV